MKQFGVCTCSHCKADVMALALTKLSPKYVVVNKTAVSPLINFYSNKYAGQITVEITKACIRVNEAPHHSRE
ncbi:MAG: late competence development ComFB family protein [Muricomes sp.]